VRLRLARRVLAAAPVAVDAAVLRLAERRLPLAALLPSPVVPLALLPALPGWVFLVATCPYLLAGHRLYGAGGARRTRCTRWWRAG